MPISPNAAHEQFVGLLKDYKRAAPTRRTAIAYELAETAVSVRESFLRADGSPDWVGRTGAYRNWYGSVFADAGILNTEERNKIQSAIRYHVNQLLRERLDPETLDEYGITGASARDRSKARHREKSALAELLSPRAVGGGVVLRLAHARTAILSVEKNSLDAELSPAEVQIADDYLTEIDAHTKALRRKLRSRK